MKQSKIINFEMDSVEFYSKLDESAFFEWLDKLEFVVSYKGVGLILNVSVDTSSIDEVAVRELLALFFRYRIDMCQLRSMAESAFPWLKDERAFWYAAMYG